MSDNGSMRDDDVIDLGQYRAAQEAEEESMGLSLIGGEGCYRHFALPLWRMAALAAANWAGLIQTDSVGSTEAVTVVDLGGFNARPAPPDGFPPIPDLDPPALIECPDGSLVLPVAHAWDRTWTVVLAIRKPEVLTRPEREDLLFLAGECSGLLLLLEEGDLD